jgi:hypothetical protein
LGRNRRLFVGLSLTNERQFGENFRWSLSGNHK